MRSRLQISLLGEPQFVFDGEPWHFGAPPRTLPMLAYLVLHAGERLSRARLAASIWPDESDDDARANLRRHAHHLSVALPKIDGVSWLIANRTTIGWNPEAPATIDVIEFERSFGERSNLARAVDLYRGDLLSGSAEEWLVADRERFQGLALGALSDLAATARLRGDFAEAIARSERILTIDEWREDALRALMAARYGSGDRSSALAAYDRFARRLRDEMHVDPMPESIALRAAILADQPLPDESHGGLESPPRAEDARGLQLPFVARDDELGALLMAWKRAAGKSGSTRFLAGEPGIGKSRLASEFANRVAGLGGRTLWGRTSSPESTPYQPLVDAVRRALPYLESTSLDPLWLSVVAPLVPELLSLRPGLGMAEPIDAERSRTRLHEAFARIFASVARARPLLLVFEDLHWAQADTIDALAVIARRAGGVAMLILGSYRDDGLAMTPHLREMVRALQAERRSEMLTLGRLRAENVASMVANMPEMAVAPSTLAPLTFRVSEGNPLFVSQLLAAYVETRVLPDESAGERSVGDAIAERVDRLEGPVRAVADVAATIGREFGADLVCEVGGWERGFVLDALGMLMDRHIVRETGAAGFEYGFSHALIATGIYQRTDAVARLARHRRIAQCMQRLDDPAMLAETARHWERAEERARASASYLRAARRAAALYARADAVEWARAAAELCDAPRERFDALQIAIAAAEKHGEAQAWGRDVAAFERVAEGLGAEERFAALGARERHAAAVGDAQAQRHAIDAMLAMTAGVHADARRIEAYDALGTFELALGRAREAIEPLRSALVEAREAGDARVIRRVHQHLIQALARIGETGAARIELRDLREKLGDGGDADERLDLLWAESSLAITTEDAGWIRSVAAEMLVLAERLRDDDLRARAHWRLGWAALTLHEIAEAREQYGTAARHFEGLGHTHPLAATLINLGMVEFDVGRLDEAIAYMDRGARLGEECGSVNIVGYALTNAADVRLEQGDVPAALADARRAYEIAQFAGERRLLATATSGLGAVLCAAGELEPGLADLRAGIELWRSMGGRESLANDLCLLIETLYVAGRRGEIAEAASELATLIADGVNQRHPARGTFALALAARAAGEPVRAKVLERDARALLSTRLAKYADEASQIAYRALPFNRRIVASAG